MSASSHLRRWLPWRDSATEHPWLTSALSFLVLAGLLGMHGFADHGMPTDVTTPMPGSMSSTSGPDGSAVAHQQVADETGSDSSAPATALGTGHRGHGDNMAAGLCLAILMGLLLGVAAWMSLSRRRPLSEHLLRLIPTTRPGGRDPDPPSLAVLSVWRC